MPDIEVYQILYKNLSLRKELIAEFKKIYENKKTLDNTASQDFLSDAISQLEKRKKEAEEKLKDLNGQSNAFIQMQGEIIILGNTINEYKEALIERQAALDEKSITFDQIEEKAKDTTLESFSKKIIYAAKSDLYLALKILNSELIAKIPKEDLSIIFYKHAYKGLASKDDFYIISDVMGRALYKELARRTPLQNGNDVNARANFAISNHQISEAIIKQVNSFKKIYHALYNGQSGPFKRDVLPGIVIDGTIGTYNKVITEYTANNPNSMIAKAWNLAQAHYANCTVENTKLFTEIYKWSFQHSGLFKQSKVSGQRFFRSSSLNAEINELTSEQIKEGEEKSNSRTAKIALSLRS